MENGVPLRDGRCSCMCRYP